MELLELEMIAATRIFKAGALRGVVQNENVVPEDATASELHLLVCAKTRYRPTLAYPHQPS